jgi:hypothetical protein
MCVRTADYLVVRFPRTHEPQPVLLRGLAVGLSERAPQAASAVSGEQARSHPHRDCSDQIFRAGEIQVFMNGIYIQCVYISIYADPKEDPHRSNVLKSHVLDARGYPPRWISLRGGPPLISDASFPVRRTIMSVLRTNLIEHFVSFVIMLACSRMFCAFCVQIFKFM